MTTRFGTHHMTEQSVAAVSIGSLRSVPFSGHTVLTGFFKEPVNGAVTARTLGLDGDVQADRTVHGGLDKAVYMYPSEHYAEWQGLLGKELRHGSFGENITSVGLREEDVYIGDELQVGDALLQVTQPRSPCYKLQIRFERNDMTALFAKQGRPGWYAAVLQEGTIAAKDSIVRLGRAQDQISVADVWRYAFIERAASDIVGVISQLPMLPDFWKERIAR